MQNIFSTIVIFDSQSDSGTAGAAIGLNNKLSFSLHDCVS